MLLDETSFEDLMLSGLVVSSRILRMATGHPAAGFEAQRMVGEKLEAAAAGFIALTSGLAAGDPRSWQRPVDTFIEPGRRTLRENAERLTGYKG